MPALTALPAADMAWEPWEPTEENPWNRRLAAHLLRRTSFGASNAELDEAVAQGPAECVDLMLAACLDGNTATQPFVDEMESMAAGLAAGEPQALEPWWLYRMLFTPTPLREQMTLFWHGHFATSAATVGDTTMMLAQNQTLRQLAFGKFQPLVQAVSRDPAMLTYLNSTTNARLHPNENYARELMELFCLGVGNYTEADIQETARCFTGWEIRNRAFRFNKHQHDFGVKTIFEQRGNFDGNDAVRIILAQDAAPRFLARKLIRFFVCDQPVSDELVAPLANELRDNDFAITPILRRILTSRMFYSQASVGQKIRSPVELAICSLRSLEGTVGVKNLAALLRPLGQRVFYPPNVKGWDGGRQWINATTLIGRVNMLPKLLSDGNTRFARGSLADYFQDKLPDAENATSAEFVDFVASLLLATPLPTSARDGLIEVAATHEGAATESAENVLLTLSAVPEFQLG